MTVHVCPADKVNAPVERVWELLMHPAGWVTLSQADGASKFEQGSALAGYAGWEFSTEPLTDEDEAAVVHNPTPSML